jgi:hypothetical protein
MSEAGPMHRDAGIAALLDKSFQPRMRPTHDPRQLLLFRDLDATLWRDSAPAETAVKRRLIALDDARPRNRGKASAG